ncbi:MAG: DUF4091 domain-containing protein [Abditibacteriota bacterium]|nr:DUF4091 domain-containing protein [Abditibacteriota bacterium]
MRPILFIALLLIICPVAYCFDVHNLSVLATNPSGYGATGSMEERDGMSFVKVTYPMFREGEDRYPSLITTLGDGYFDQTDFSAFKYLYALVYNPSDVTFALLRIDDTSGKRANYQVPLKPHDYTLCVIETSLITSIDITQVCLLDVYYKEPEDARELWISHICLADAIDDLTLTLASRTMTRECEEALKKIRGKKGEWCAAGQARLEELYTVLTGPASPEKENAVRNMQYVPRAIEDGISYFSASHKEAYSVYTMPSTLKLRNDQAPKTKKSAIIRMDAARGESESVSLLVTANTRDLSGVRLDFEPLRDKQGRYIYPEIHPLGYVEVKNPTPGSGGFETPGFYPDPILPNEPFDVAKDKNVTCLFTVSVPRDAEPGDYKGSITVSPQDEKPTRLQVSLRVYDVTLLPQSYLRQIFVTRNMANNSAYYDQWTDEHFKAFTKLHLKYRICCQQHNSEGMLDFGSVFSTDSKGRTVADWRRFDADVDYWFRLGMTQFCGYFTGWADSIDAIGDKDYLRTRLGLLASHLKERGWLDRFYLYIYDEPSPDKQDQIIKLCEWVHREGPGLRIIHTYNYHEQEPFIGHADVIVADIGVFVPEIGDKVRENKGEYWAYTCISNRVFEYPDNWKIDNYGTSHRALGWWLKKYKAQGYLYWGTDFWVVDPWETTETFPYGNGDGSLFYPSKDRSSLPYPSLRLDNYRDGVEEFDLLTMLEDKYKADPFEVLKLKKSVVDRKGYLTDDDTYIRLHREMLQLLEKPASKRR